MSRTKEDSYEVALHMTRIALQGEENLTVEKVHAMVDRVLDHFGPKWQGEHTENLRLTAFTKEESDKLKLDLVERFELLTRIKRGSKRG